MTPNTNTPAAAPAVPIADGPDVALPFEQLTADEVQELRRVMEASRLNRSFKTPELPIAEIDKDNFADCLVSGQPYTETFDRFKGKLNVTFRSRFKWEEDAIIAQIFKDWEDKVIMSDGQYVNRLNIYNLSYQMETLDGVAQVQPKKGEDLRAKAAAGIFEVMPEPKLYILVSLLHQFDAKVSTLCRLAMPDFSKPDADS